MRTRTTVRAMSIVAVLSLPLGACASNDPTAETPPAEDLADERTDDETDDGRTEDVVFVRGMIPHHVGAVDMAEMVADRTDRRQLTDQPLARHRLHHHGGAGRDPPGGG